MRGASFQLPFSGKIRMAVEAISSVGEVLASRNVSTSSGGLEWLVTFMNNAGDLPLLVADSSAMWGGVAVSVAEERMGTSMSVSGSFELGVSGDESKSETVSHDASSGEVCVHGYASLWEMRVCLIGATPKPSEPPCVSSIRNPTTGFMENYTLFSGNYKLSPIYNPMTYSSYLTIVKYIWYIGCKCFG